MSVIDSRLPTNVVLAELLQNDRVPMETLHERYHALLELVRVLIGVVPLCDPYLEIWPPAFQTYNVLVPNFLNLPMLIFSNSVPRDIVGLGMYASSRSAQCPYCSAHTFAFACRRGMDVAKVADVEQRLTAHFTPRELATMDVAVALGKVPSVVTPALREGMRKHFRPPVEEWVVAGMCMMGFLNKFMDAIGVELEQSAANESYSVIAKDGWDAGKAGWFLNPLTSPRAAPKADSLFTKLRLIPYLPSAKKYDDVQTRGVPTKWPALGKYLQERTGHDFPVLGRLYHWRFRRAIGAMVLKNLDPATSTTGMAIKCAAAAIFAHVSSNEALKEVTKAISAKFGVSDEILSKAMQFAETGNGIVFEDEKLQALVTLAAHASPTPAQVSHTTVDTLRNAKVSPAQIVEVVAWLSVLQMLNRVTSYFVPGWNRMGKVSRQGQ